MNLFAKFIEEYHEHHLYCLKNRGSFYFDCDDYVEYNGCKEEKGCYFIDDFYIGKTKLTIKTRIDQHLHDVYDVIVYGWQMGKYKYRPQISNKFKVYQIYKKFLNNEKIIITLLSKNLDDEKELIEEYSKKHKLTNYEFNRKNHPDNGERKLLGESILKEIRKEYKKQKRKGKYKSLPPFIY